MSREPEAVDLASDAARARARRNHEPTRHRGGGEIDVATSPLLRIGARIGVAQGPDEVTLDLHGVSFVDSSGLGVLVGALSGSVKPAGSAS